HRSCAGWISIRSHKSGPSSTGPDRVHAHGYSAGLRSPRRNYVRPLLRMPRDGQASAPDRSLCPAAGFLVFRPCDFCVVEAVLEKSPKVGTETKNLCVLSWGDSPKNVLSASMISDACARPARSAGMQNRLPAEKR